MMYTYLLTYLLTCLLAVLYFLTCCCVVPVSMIFQIAYDIRFFLLVLFLVLAGFAQAFFILSVDAEGFPFSTVRGAFLNSFIYMLGSYDTDFTGTALPQLGTLLVVIFLLIMAILMLNLLIALMGQSFATVAENGLGQWKYELASILIDQAELLDISIAPCIFVLKYTSEIVDDETPKLSNDQSQSQGPVIINKSATRAAWSSSNESTLSMRVDERTDKPLPPPAAAIMQVGTELSQQLTHLKNDMNGIESKFDSRLRKLEQKIDKLLSLVADDD